MGGENYNCRYDEGTDEARMYHDGYKEGLDECYNQMPIQGYVSEEPQAEVVDNMASWGAVMDENNAFSVYEDAKMKDWAAELNSLLNEDKVQEGMTVSISKGQQGSPDSVSITAQDAEADQLLAIVKQAGLGLFGGDDQGHSSAMSMPADAIADTGAEPGAEIAVVDDHDDMLSLIRKMTGQGQAQSSDDYEDEENSSEESCGDCGGSPCNCNIVDEVETPDQAEEMAVEGEPGEEPTDDDSGDGLPPANGGYDENDPQSDGWLDRMTNEDGDNVAAAGGQEAKEDSALSAAAGQADAADEAKPEEQEEELEEGYANGADDTFESDIEFMTKVISGGLNGPKSTGQATIPVVASQTIRLGAPMKESTDLLQDFRKLSGIR